MKSAVIKDSKAGVMKLMAAILLVLHGGHTNPVPTASTDFPQQTPFDALMNCRSVASRLHGMASTAYDAIIQEEFNGDSGYCVEEIVWEELLSVRIPTSQWRNLGDEERLQRVRRDLQLFGLFLEEVLMDELDKNNHTDTASSVDQAVEQLDVLVTAIDVTNNVLDFIPPTDVTDTMSPSLRDPASESARAIRDCVVLRDFKLLVERAHRDFTLLCSKYRD